MRTLSLGFDQVGVPCRLGGSAGLLLAQCAHDDERRTTAHAIFPNVRPMHTCVTLFNGDSKKRREARGRSSMILGATAMIDLQEFLGKGGCLSAEAMTIQSCSTWPYVFTAALGRSVGRGGGGPCDNPQVPTPHMGRLSQANPIIRARSPSPISSQTPPLGTTPAEAIPPTTNPPRHPSALRWRVSYLARGLGHTHTLSPHGHFPFLTRPSLPPHHNPTHQTHTQGPFGRLARPWQL